MLSKNGAQFARKRELSVRSACSWSPRPWASATLSPTATVPGPCWACARQPLRGLGCGSLLLVSRTRGTSRGGIWGPTSPHSLVPSLAVPHAAQSTLHTSDLCLGTLAQLALCLPTLSFLDHQSPVVCSPSWVLIPDTRLLASKQDLGRHARRKLGWGCLFCVCLSTKLPAPGHRGWARSHPQKPTLCLACSRRSRFSGGTEWDQRHGDLSSCQQAALELAGMISSEVLEVKEISHPPERASQACEVAPAAVAQGGDLGGGPARPLAPGQAGIPHSLSWEPP